jgi:hypothetical protein
LACHDQGPQHRIWKPPFKRDRIERLDDPGQAIRLDQETRFQLVLDRNRWQDSKAPNVPSVAKVGQAFLAVTAIHALLKVGLGLFTVAQALILAGLHDTTTDHGSMATTVYRRPTSGTSPMSNADWLPRLRCSTAPPDGGTEPWRSGAPAQPRLAAGQGVWRSGNDPDRVGFGVKLDQPSRQRIDHAPAAFGGGNKLLHNVSGGIGVVESNGGLLRGGLPRQSVHDGTDLASEPLRLWVLVEALQQAIDDMLARHDGVRRFSTTVGCPC